MASDPNKLHNLMFEGCVHKIGAKHVYLKFSQGFHEKYNGEDYTVSVEASRTIFRRAHQAVSLSVRNLGRDVLFPSKVLLKTPQISFVFDPYFDDFVTESLNTSNEETKQEKRKMVSYKNLVDIMEKSNAELKSPKIKLEWYNTKLNYYQKEAVRNVLLGVSRPLPYIIFGPPGTGKTVTLVEVILQILRMLPHSRILIGTPSNNAADLIALRLINSGVLNPGDLVRLVSLKFAMDDKIPLELIPYCATVYQGKEGTFGHEATVLENGLILGSTSSAIGRHRITVSTCFSLGQLYTMGFSKNHFTHFIIDEAGQATEPEIMVPLSLMDRDLGQIVLAGKLFSSYYQE